MKKLLFIVFLFAFTNGISFSQDIFSLDNAKWTGEYINEGIEHRYFSYVIHGDTVVDDIVRSKLYYIPNINKTDTFLTGYFHIAGDIVFYRKHEIELGVFANGLYEICEEYELDYPLYDFSLQEEDIYPYACNYVELKVTSIEYVEFGGFIRKKIIFNGNYPFYWMEGMGSFEGFLVVKSIFPSQMDRIITTFVLA
jgi:hypothetical protein